MPICSFLLVEHIFRLFKCCANVLISTDWFGATLRLRPTRAQNLFGSVIRTWKRRGRGNWSTERCSMRVTGNRVVCITGIKVNRIITVVLKIALIFIFQRTRWTIDSALKDTRASVKFADSVNKTFLFDFRAIANLNVEWFLKHSTLFFVNSNWKIYF